MEQPNVVDITADNFEHVIVEQSKQNLIVIGFWTARDENCVNLMAQIESRVVAAGAGVIFAKIDVDSQMQIAMQFGVQSVPTVALFKDARPVDSFMGMKSDAELDEFFAAHLPKEQDTLLSHAVELMQNNDHAAAFPLLKKAHELDGERADIKLAYADACIQLGKVAEAEQLLQSIKMVEQDSYYQSLQSALELALSAADSPEIKALQQQVEQSPDDNELKVQLAIQLNQANRNDEALDLLFMVLKKDMSFGEAKKIFLDILATLPEGDGLASSYRRKLYSLLY